MTMLGTDNPLFGTDGTLAPGPRTGVLDSFADAWRQTRLLNLSDSEALAREDAWNDMLGQVNASLPANTRPYVNPAYADKGVAGKQAAEEALYGHIRQARELNRAAYPGLPDNSEKFDAWLSARVKREAQDLDIALSRPSGFLADVAGFAGGAAATLTDPLQIALLPFGAARGAGLLRTAITEAGLGAASSAVSAPAVAAWRDDVGLDYGADEFLSNLTLSAGGGAAFGVAAHAIPHAVRLAAGLGGLAGKKLLDRFARDVPRPLSEEAAAADLVQAADDFHTSSPLGDLAGGQEEHLSRSQAALSALADERAPDMPDTPAGPVLDSGDAFSRPAYSQLFKPSDIGIDAARFQFKSGGDDFGVLPTLRDVQHFDSVLAGDLMLWEDKSGKIWAADGHQRTGLAKRAEAAGQDVRLSGDVWREADGVTADDMRVWAAFVNVVRGTASPADAAKVIREAPRLFEHPSIPRVQESYRTAHGMARLSDDAFMMAVNDVVPAHFAAIVGREVADKDLHAPILGLLAKSEPANVTQAESIVRDAMAAGATKETQATLFGDEAVTHLLLKERARVLDGTVKLMNRDRKVFGTLLDEQRRITAAGNVLAEGANALRVDQANQALGILLKLAHRKGPLADALNQAARTAREKGTRAAVADFAEAVRRELENGALAGAAPDTAGRPPDAGPQAPRRDGGPQTGADARLEGFTNPGHGESLAQARQLEHEAREELAMQGDDAPVPQDPLTGDAISTQDMFAEFDREDAALNHLQTCIAGGKA